ncbi:twin-arginine translocation signal domain-containing protein [Cyclobacterium marinum]|jgi:hypothetical protein|uniref:Twin-arginine translocation signal domain-containing protein n=1 Tax=Cyclobacterium marinum (strain ATCC 25205 / DSM 745 / LMG 13164 / NCIMB 1802) TaxID=880070 RepID=G0IYE5_CYCMS|nr:twin-arginine translocation signal domain-containing protein [Cyclobacterium marinum]AEL25680.1 hypothetical protein Cycma_1932 [Cyclobacterium marinum DSM 745]
MNYLDRRNFLKLSGLALGGLSAGLLSNPSMARGFKKNLSLGFVGIKVVA